MKRKVKSHHPEGLVSKREKDEQLDGTASNSEHKDGKQRCDWPSSAKASATRRIMWFYHDTEWGTPTYEDRRFYEFLVLGGGRIA